MKFSSRVHLNKQHSKILTLVLLAALVVIFIFAISTIGYVNGKNHAQKEVTFTDTKQSDILGEFSNASPSVTARITNSGIILSDNRMSNAGKLILENQI